MLHIFARVATVSEGTGRMVSLIEGAVALRKKWFYLVIGTCLSQERKSTNPINLWSLLL
jgi:hypothetical protein